MTSTIGVQSFKVLARPWRALCTCNVPRAKIFAVELLAYLYFNFHEILQTCSSWLVLLVCEVSNFLRDHDAHYARAKFRASKYFEFNRFQKSYDLLMSSLNTLLLSKWQYMGDSHKNQPFWVMFTWLAVIQEAFDLSTPFFTEVYKKVWGLSGHQNDFGILLFCTLNH